MNEILKISGKIEEEKKWKKEKRMGVNLHVFSGTVILQRNYLIILKRKKK